MPGSYCVSIGLWQASCYRNVGGAVIHTGPLNFMAKNIIDCLLFATDRSFLSRIGYVAQLVGQCSRPNGYGLRGGLRGAAVRLRRQGRLSFFVRRPWHAFIVLRHFAASANAERAAPGMHSAAQQL